MELRIFCEFFYASHYVPVTVLQGGQVLFHFYCRWNADQHSNG